MVKVFALYSPLISTAMTTSQLFVMRYSTSSDHNCYKSVSPIHQTINNEQFMTKTDKSVLKVEPYK